jgi:hypothetical protein
MPNIEDKNSTSSATPKGMEGIFYRQGREGFKKGRTEKISLK